MRGPVPDPPALGFIVAAPKRHAEQVGALARESLSALRALKADAVEAPRASPEADFVVLVVEPSAPLPEMPDLKDRAAVALAVAEDEAEGRVAVTAARKHLRNAGAALGARQLVLTPSHFGFMGLESDNAREKLHILLQTLVLDAERLRLRREGWEEPDE